MFLDTLEHQKDCWEGKQEVDFVVLGAHTIIHY